MLELFSGLGAAGLAWGLPVHAAIDQSANANAAYALNHGLQPKAWNLVGVRAAQLAPFSAEPWWMSPPCQPFTVRGARRDLEDPRTRALLRVLDLLVELRPPVVAMENVPGFVESTTRGHLRATLIGAGYTLSERLLCPTALGIPMRRQRYYLVAQRDGDGRHRADFAPPPPIAPIRPIAAFLDPEPDPELTVDEALVRAHGHSVHFLDTTDPTEIANCFTSAYGRSNVRSGSYLRDRGVVRRFSPEEVVRLLGFPSTWTFPPELSREARWDLAGNSLTVDGVRRVLGDAGVLPVGVGAGG